MKLFVFLLVLINICSAQNTWRNYVEDDYNYASKNIGASTLIYSGLWLGGMAALSQYDEQIHQSVLELNNDHVKNYFDLTNELGNPFLVVPLTLGIWGLAYSTDNERLQKAAFTSFESVIVADIIVLAGKYIFGRSRPLKNKGAHQYQPFSGNDSFPSGHSSTVFAFFTPYIYYYQNPARFALIILPVSTAGARMVKNKHWLTDVLTGSLIGFLTGKYLTQWHKKTDKKNKNDDMIIPVIRFNISLN